MDRQPRVTWTENYQDSGLTPIVVLTTREDPIVQPFQRRRAAAVCFPEGV
jgi:hypothetical protein